MDKPLINRVANSNLKLINLENYYPETEIVEFDLKPLLFKELILREKDFRAALKEIDWSLYQGKTVLLFNSNDAIIPVWAYMLVSTSLMGFANEVFQGSLDEYLKTHYSKVLESFDVEAYNEERVVIKGCSNKPVPAFAYAELAYRLKDHAQSIMYGEPCSTVPIFKRPRKLPLKD